MTDSRTKSIAIGGGLSVVALAAVLFVVYSGGSESSVPPLRTEATLDDPQHELSEDGQVMPVRNIGARSGDEDRSRLGSAPDEGAGDTTADDGDPPAKKNAKNKRKKRGRKTSEREQQEEEQSKNERRWPKPSLTPPGKP